MTQTNCYHCKNDEKLKYKRACGFTINPNYNGNAIIHNCIWNQHSFATVQTKSTAFFCEHISRIISGLCIWIVAML